MDFSGLILIPMAGLVTAIWLIASSILFKPHPSFRGPFLLAYGLGVLFLQPWHVSSWQHLGMLAIMLVIMALSIAVGCILGAIPALILIASAKKVRQLLMERSRG